MTATTSPPPTSARALRAPVSGTTVVLLAALMAFADGFWLTSLQGAIGAIERAQGPFLQWLSDSTLMLPAFVLATWAGLWVGHRRYGRDLGAARPVLFTGVVVALAGSVVGTVALALSSAYDYHLQVQLLDLLHGTHTTEQTVPAETGECLSLCQAQRATLALHVRAVLAASVVLLVTNVVLVGWAVALRGGRLDSGAGRAG